MAAVQSILCYPRLGIPLATPPRLGYAGSTSWKKSLLYYPPNRYEPVDIFRQYEITDSFGNVIGANIYSSQIKDNFLLCSGNDVYRIIEVI